MWLHVSHFGAFIDGVLKPVDMEAVAERVETLSAEANRAELRALLASASADQVAIVEAHFHASHPKIVRQAFGLMEVDPEAQAIADNLRP